MPRNLRNDLLQKLGVTPQALNQRAQRIKKRVPMTTGDAYHVIAHQEGLVLDKYLDRAGVDRIRELWQQTSAQSSDFAPRARERAPSPRATSTQPLGLVPTGDLRLKDPLLSSTKLKEARAMAAVFPLLYVLENSMRQLIDRVMRAKHGGNWWPKCAPQGLQAAVAKRMADDERDSWHQRRGAREIDYLDLNQLPALVRNNQKDFFPTILSTIEWFDQFVKEIYTSRCVVCHMNPLDSNNIRAVEVRRKQWEKQLSAKLHLL